jgi:tetratricopeptide (TPR) repeat protein
VRGPEWTCLTLFLDSIREVGLRFLGVHRGAVMDSLPRHALSRTSRFLLSILIISFVLPIPSRCQDSGAEGTLLRGDKAEISVTVRDSSGSVITAAATARLYRSGGTPVAESATAQGRAFFVVPRLGDYTLVVQAAGYKTAQKEVSVLAAVKMEADIYLQRDSSAADLVSAPGPPVLAPKAKELFDKAVKALGEDNLDEAEKYIGETLKLAPSHPDVLYIQGVVHLKKRKWGEAQAVLEKATQLDANHAPALAALGMTLTNQGKYEAAIVPLEKSLQLNDKTGYEARWALAKAYYHHELYDQALKTSQEALTESNGKAPEIELLVAQSLTAVGRYEDSAQALRDFLKNHGNDPQAPTAKRWLARLAADGKIGSQ